jgi:hypothetical protein
MINLTIASYLCQLRWNEWFVFNGRKQKGTKRNQMNTIRIVKGSNNRTWDDLLTDKSVKIDFFFLFNNIKDERKQFLCCSFDQYIICFSSERPIIWFLFLFIKWRKTILSISTIFQHSNCDCCLDTQLTMKRRFVIKNNELWEMPRSLTRTL